MRTEVADRYNEALFELARDSKDLTSKKSEAEEVLKVFEDTEELNVFFRAVKISKEQKKAFICNTFGKQIDDELVNFLQLLVDKGRMDSVKEILQEYIEKINAELGIKKAIVYSVRPLEESDLTKVKETLEKKNGCTVEIQNKIDSSLVAGIKVVMENQVTDISMKKKLDSLKESLLKGGLA